jgi:transmembrane sensor
VSKSDATASDITRLRDASEWVQRLSESNEEDAQALTDQWLQWCKSDALNLSAYEQMQRVWDAFPDVRDTTSPALKPLNRLEHRIGLIALAASIVLAVGVAAWVVSGYSDVQEFATTVGKQRSIILTDGSHLDLAPDSLVSTRFTLTKRDIQLKRGQAFFAVTHSAIRPFIVHVGALTVTAIGTAFDVRIGPSSTVVTVSEGRVGVSPGVDESAHGSGAEGETIRASIGERVTFSKSAHRLSLATVDPKVAESWRDGKLQFVGESLEEVVAAVNRYSAARIVVAPALLQTRFTGTVLPYDVHEWLKALEQIYAVTVVDQGVDGVLIRTRADRGARK